MVLLTTNLNAQSQNWWRVNGNTPSSSDFLGTTNNTSLIFKTNNISRFRIDANGDIASTNFIGTTNRLLFVNANGTILPFTMGTNTQVLYGNGTWGSLPVAATTFTNNGADLVLPTNTKLGIGVNAPTEALDISGNLKISGNIKSGNLAGNGMGLVYADSLGNLYKPIAPNPGNPPVGVNAPCVPSSLPWFNGGNYVNSTGLNEAGTCNAIDFVLKSNNVLSQWIKPSGSIGFGANFTSNTGDPLQFIFSNGLVRSTGNNAYGGPMYLFNGPTSPNGDWGIEYTGGTTATQAGLNFWKPYGSTNANNNVLFLHDNNRIGIGTDNPSTRLTIDAWNDDGVKIMSDQNKNSITVYDKTNSKTVFNVQSDGKTYIGIQKPKNSSVHANAMLSVDGKILAKEIFVNIHTSTWADYVFDSNYKLMPLKELEDFVIQNKHLPNVPSAKYLTETDDFNLSIADMQKIQMEKIEELYLYVIEQQKQIEKLEKENKELKAFIKK